MYRLLLELHTLTQAACSYALLLHLIKVGPAYYSNPYRS